MFKKKRIYFFLLVISLLSNEKSYASTSDESTERLISNILAPTPIFDDLSHLTDKIGGRPTGSFAMNEAQQWALNRFIDAGFKDAHMESYTAPRNWLPNIEQGEVLDSNRVNEHLSRPLRIAALPFSRSTPPEGLTAPVYALKTAEVNDIQEHVNQIKGHWLLIPIAIAGSNNDLLNEDLKTSDLFFAAKNAGAVGILWLSNRPNRLLYRHAASLNGKLAALPGVVIEREGGERIIRRLKAGEPIEFKAILINIIQEKPQNYNIVVELKGSEKPDEVILLGAHLDSWDLGQGALDNGSNAAMVIDIARQMFALHRKGFHSRRTIRFVLYSGEEFGLFGSWFDVKNHSKSLDSIKAVIIYDIGTGRTTGFSLGGRHDMKQLVKQALQPVSALGPFTQTTDASFGTDNFDYLLKGIPTLVANQDTTDYLPVYHAETDTLDKVDRRELKLNTVIAAVLTWRLANMSNQIPPRQNTTQIHQLLEATGLKKEMQHYHLWNDFIKQKR